MSSDRKPWVSNLFAKWDQVVFAGVPSSVYQSESLPTYNEQQATWQALLNATSNLDLRSISALTPLVYQSAYQPPSLLTSMQAPAPDGAAICSNAAITVEKSVLSPSNMFTNLSANTMQLTSESASGLAAQKLTAFPPSITSDSDPEDASNSNQFSPAPSWYSQDQYHSNLGIEVLSIHQDTDTLESTSSQEQGPIMTCWEREREREREGSDYLRAAQSYWAASCKAL
ncbi:hypothetical protein H2248_002079 [Termitomyces sp. 'cryptogamus']|nr:hypothetical protein H2248_002079 [Termitomyces sp. 'cryptogamus']